MGMTQYELETVMSGWPPPVHTLSSLTQGNQRLQSYCVGCKLRDKTCRSLTQF